MEKHDLLVLNELTESGSNLRPSIQVEHALAEIKDSYQTPPLAKIPFTEIAALGGSFAGVVETMATPAAEGLYRCVFPKGITGTLAMAKDGSGALGTIMNDGIVGQARWIPVDKAIGPACFKAALVAVAVLAVVKQVQDIKDGQKEIVSILERDKKSQLLADYDLIASYMDDYKFYWENEASLVVNLNQVKNIKRNAMKDLRSYIEQLEGMLSAKKSLLKMQTASYKIGQILDRFVHYLCHGFHISFDEGVHGHPEHVGKQQQALDIRIRTAALPVADGLARHVDALRQIVLGQSELRAMLLDVRAQLHAFAP